MAPKTRQKKTTTTTISATSSSRPQQQQRKPAFKNTYGSLENAPQLFAALCICFNIPSFSRQVQFVTRAVHDYIRAFHYNTSLGKIKTPLPLDMVLFLDFVMDTFPLDNADDRYEDFQSLFPEWFFQEPNNPNGRQSTPVIGDAEIVVKLNNARTVYMEHFVPLFFTNFVHNNGGENRVRFFVIHFF